jgi:hypothetical protein
MGDRFAAWPRLRALAALIALAMMLAASAFVPLTVGRGEVAKPAQISLTGNAGKQAERPRDDDLTLYDHAVTRIRHGENYYDFIAQEHRKADYPCVPALPSACPRWPISTPPWAWTRPNPPPSPWAPLWC